VNDVVYAVKRPVKPLGVAHIADKIAHTSLIENMFHLDLFQLVTAEHDEPRGLEAPEHGLDEFLPEGSRASRDKDGFSVQAHGL